MTAHLQPADAEVIRAVWNDAGRSHADVDLSTIIDVCIAVTSQVPVLPVAIHGTGRIWPPGRRAIRGGQVRVVIGRPLPASRLSHHDVAGLRERARDVIWAARRDLVTAMSAKAVS